MRHAATCQEPPTGTSCVSQGNGDIGRKKKRERERERVKERETRNEKHEKRETKMKAEKKALVCSCFTSHQTECANEDCHPKSEGREGRLRHAARLACGRFRSTVALRFVSSRLSVRQVTNKQTPQGFEPRGRLWSRLAPAKREKRQRLHQ